MAITVWGVDPSITETKWAILMAALGRGAWDETVSDTGGQLVCAPGGGSRQVTVQDGDCVAAGVLGQNTSAVTTTHDANATAFTRYDYVVFEIDWTGTNTTGGTIEVVKGSTSSQLPPTLTKTAGTLWQIPLALVTIAPSAGVLGASAVKDVRPMRRRVLRYRTDPAGGQSMGNSVTTPRLISSIDVADPGWPYRIRVSAQVRFEELTSSDGFGRLEFNIDGGSQEAETRAPDRNKGVAQISYTGAIRAATPATCKLHMLPVNMAGGGEPLALAANYSQFIIEVVPA